tara:strand:- start:997 stop:1530 length:534 start_codon:yes stop_codon:yes gene_type:complete
MKPSSLYEPAEDSDLLGKHIKDYAHGRVLDMGTGSGILAQEAAAYADSVVAVDVDLDVITWCEQLKKTNIQFFQSDLFSNVSGKFDLIMFNAPYLPKDKGIKDKALYGGKEGWETIGRFLKEAKKYLNEDGKTLLVFSSTSKPEKIKTIMVEEGYTFKLLDKVHISFEDILLYELSL